MDEKSLKPQLRFKGFADAWEQRKVSTVAGVYDGVHQTPDYQDDGIMFLSVENISTLRSEKFISEEAFKKGYKVYPEKGDILMTRIGDVGTPNVVETSEKIAFYVSLALLKPHGIDSYFLKNAIQSSGFQQGLKERTLLTAIPMKINKNEIGKVDVSISKKHQEQKQIGCFFHSLDNLITLHQRKLDKLSNVKKALLEKMFPKNDSDVPEIRFKGFTDAWEQRKFKSTIQIERGGSPRPIEDYITNSENALNWIKIGDAPSMGKYITKTAEKIKPEGLSKTREVHPGDLILSNSMSFGRPYIMAINGCIHDGWLLLRNDKNLYDLQFLCHLLGSENMLHQYKSFAAGSTVNNLNKDLVGNTTVSFPKKTEQSKLGAFFDSLDNLITLHQRKLEKLKNIKKACLEKMFV